VRAKIDYHACPVEVWPRAALLAEIRTLLRDYEEMEYERDRLLNAHDRRVACDVCLSCEAHRGY